MTYMFLNTPQAIAQEWEKYLGFTVRPLPSTINYYANIITEQLENNNHPSLMIYGGTPEIRSICQGLDIRTTIIDRSIKMVEAMGLLTFKQQSLSANENYIACDWLSIDLPAHSFDILIADV